METLKMKKSTLPRWWKRRFTATITEADPSCKVVYLGNVLTGWAKGEGCLDKPLATLWKNYCQSSRPDVSMRLSVCSSGLQATTSEHGLTEYWAHRVTWCAAPPSYPRIFAWVYRHEGRRLKQELRCHAVLCATSRQGRQLTTRLEQRLREALYDFRREKMCRQAARLSLAACLYDDYSNAIPKRKLLLAPGVNNYKPPVERSKSAPKLGSIEESPEQEIEEEKDWLRVLALRGSTTQCLSARNTVMMGKLSTSSATSSTTSPLLLETVREESPASAIKLLSIECESTVTTTSPDDVSPDGLLDLAEVKVTLMPDGGTSCVDGGPSPSATASGIASSPTTSTIAASDGKVIHHRLALLSRMGAEARKKFGSADCVIDKSKTSSRTPSSPPPPVLPRRARRSLPCRAASINDYTASMQLQHNRVLTRRQSQPEYVGVARRPTSEYIESRDEYLYDDEIDFRLRLDSEAVELLESDPDSFDSNSSPCCSADHSPHLTDKGRVTGGSGTDDPLLVNSSRHEDNDNVSDESGYSDDKDVISSSSSVASATSSLAAKMAAAKGIPYGIIAEEFTLNL